MPLLAGARVMGCSPPPSGPGMLIAEHVSPGFAAATVPVAGEFGQPRSVTVRIRLVARERARRHRPAERVESASPRRRRTLTTLDRPCAGANGLTKGLISRQRGRSAGGSPSRQEPAATGSGRPDGGGDGRERAHQAIFAIRGDRLPRRSNRKREVHPDGCYLLARVQAEVMTPNATEVCSTPPPKIVRPRGQGRTHDDEPARPAPPRPLCGMPCAR